MLSSSAVHRVCGDRLGATAKLIAVGLQESGRPRGGPGLDHGQDGGEGQRGQRHGRGTRAWHAEPQVLTIPHHREAVARRADRRDRGDTKATGGARRARCRRPRALGWPDVTSVLVTGMSGTGKSTVLIEFGQRGHRVVDTDYSGWTEDVTSQPRASARSPQPAWTATPRSPSRRTGAAARCTRHAGQRADPPRRAVQRVHDRPSPKEHNRSAAALQPDADADAGAADADGRREAADRDAAARQPEPPSLAM